MTITKEVRRCDHCNSKIPKGNGIKTKDVPNEGCSEIENHNGEYVMIGGQDFCSFDCLVEWLRKGLFE